MAREVIGQLIITVPITAETEDNVSDDYSGGIRSHSPSHAYDRGWDRIFGQKSKSDANAKPN